MTTRKKYPWFRLSWQVLGDHKLRLIETMSLEQPMVIFGTWVSLLCIAGRSDPGPDGGRLLIAKGRPCTSATIAIELGLEEARLEQLLSCFEELGMISPHEEGGWYITNWGSHQKKSDYSAGRVAAHRARQKEEEEKKPDPNPGGNGPAGLDKLPKVDDKVLDLVGHFINETGLTPPASGAVERWRDDWLVPAGQLLKLADNDIERAHDHMTEVIAIMRQKSLRITRPGSLVNPTRRWLTEQAWAQVAKKMKQVGYTGDPQLPEDLDRCVRRAGGWPAICAMDSKTAEGAFRRAYMGGLRA